MVGVLGAYSNQDIKATTGQIYSLLERARSQRTERSPRPVVRPTVAKTTPVEQQQAIAADYRSGMRIKEIAQKHGVHRVTVRTCLDRAGVEIRPKGLTATQLDEAQRLYEVELLSLAAIGERFGVTSKTVHLRLRERGVPMRDTHGRPQST